MPWNQQHSPLDLSLVWALLRRALFSLITMVILLVGVGVTGVIALRSRPVYRSEAVLLYQDRNASNPVATQRADSMSPRRIGLTLQEMLFSRTLLEKLIKEFGLYAKTVDRFGLVAAAEEMQKHDLHFATREGYTFRLSFDSTSPEVAQAVAARATEYLIRAHVDSRVDEIKEMERFLDGEKQRIEKELHERESAFSLFVAKNPGVLDLGVGRTSVELDGSGAETASLSLEMQALQLRERLSQLRLQPSSPTQGALPSFVPREANESRVRAEAELLAAQRELADKQTQFTEEHPDVKRAMVRFASAKSRVRQLDEAPAAAASPGTDGRGIPSPVSSAGADSGEARLLQQQIELLEKQKRAVRSRGRSPSRVASGNPDQLGRLRAQYVDLERRARESREHLALLEDRQFQAEMQTLFTTQSRRADLVVADAAFKPTVPLRSPRGKILGIGIGATLFIALALGLLLAIRDDRLRQAADFRRFDLPPLLGEIPPP